MRQQLLGETREASAPVLSASVGAGLRHLSPPGYNGLFRQNLHETTSKQAPQEANDRMQRGEGWCGE